MNYSELLYPHFEVTLQEELNSLHSEIILTLDKASAMNAPQSKDLVLDGFYPYYTEQKLKLLFIGREALGLSGENYIDIMHHCYKTDGAIGNHSLDQSKFHSLMIRLAYALNAGSPDWSIVPTASQLVQQFAESNGFSFAFMNYSKFSNESDEWEANWSLIDCYAERMAEAKTNLYTKQIELLNPDDVILAMNLEARLNSLGNLEPIEFGPQASYYRLETPSKSFLLMDLFHFSAINKDQDIDFYQPILRGLEQYEVQ